eukprot:1188359-Prorocentrum_minimum.AAC.4
MSHIPECTSTRRVVALPQAAVNPEEPLLAHHLNPSCFMVLQSGSDCVIKVQGAAGVPPGCIALDEAHMVNLHIGPDIQRSFKVFLPPPPDTFALTDITFEGKS